MHAYVCVCGAVPLSIFGWLELKEPDLYTYIGMVRSSFCSWYVCLSTAKAIKKRVNK